MKATAGLEFIPIGQTTPEIQESVRASRNLPQVREHMYTDHEITPEEHARWLSSLEKNATTQVFIVIRNGAAIGLVSLTRISPQHQTADWAFYLHPETQGSGLGVAIEFALLEHAFHAVGLKKLNCEVLETNPGVIKLHKKFGFQEEGVRRQNIVKNNIRIGVFLLGMTADEWEAQRDRFARIVERM